MDLFLVCLAHLKHPYQDILNLKSQYKVNRLTAWILPFSRSGLPKEPNVVKINCTREDLPYVEIPGINGQLLIDSGSWRSLLDPQNAHKYFKSQIFREHIKIKTAHDTSFHSSIVHSWVVSYSSCKISKHLLLPVS